MDTWIKVTLAVSVPTLSFLVLHDTVQGFYGPKHPLPLSYVVVEPEELAAEEEAEQEAALEEAPAEEEVAEAPAEEADSDDAAAADAPADDTIVEDTVADAPADDTVEAAPADDAVLMATLTADEMKTGEAAARACASCHQLARDRNSVGPHLVGLAGRAIGGVDGFRYSDALIALNAEGAVWDAAALEAWLENPDAFAEGTKMMFKVDDPEERRLIAGWLMEREE